MVRAAWFYGKSKYVGMASGPRLSRRAPPAVHLTVAQLNADPLFTAKVHYPDGGVAIPNPPVAASV